MSYLKRKQIYAVKVEKKDLKIEGTIFIKARSIKKALKKVKRYGDYSVIEVKYVK